MRLSLVIPAFALKVTYPSNTDSTLLKKELFPEAEENTEQWSEIKRLLRYNKFYR